MKVTPINFFKSVVKEPEQFYIIHYSSQSLYDADSAGHSPRITSIAVMHFATRQTTSFSAHAVADLLKIGKDEIESRYNEIEKEMLSGFFDFMKGRFDKYWIHWRMQNLTYGFEHLEHRSRFLGNPDPPRVPFENRLDLSAILRAKYGRDYVPDPKMMNLALQNGPLPQGFLTGEQEAAAFKNKDFIRMHASTLAKVDFFRHIILLAQQGRLRTATSSWGVRVDRLLEGRIAKVIALGAGVVGGLGCNLSSLALALRKRHIALLVAKSDRREPVISSATGRQLWDLPN